MSQPQPIQSLLRSSQNATGLSDSVNDIITQDLMSYPLPVPHEDCSILVYLIENFHTDLALRMIEAGADIKQKSKIDYQPLHAAAGIKDVEVFKELIRRGASVHAKTTQKASVLHYALVDNLTDEMTEAALDAVEKPLWALKTKGMGPTGRALSGFEMFAQYAQGEDRILFALQKMQERHVLSDLKEGDSSSQYIYRAMKNNLVSRFGENSKVIHYLDTFRDAEVLQDLTPEVEPTRARPRF